MLSSRDFHFPTLVSGRSITLSYPTCFLLHAFWTSFVYLIYMLYTEVESIDKNVILYKEKVPVMVLQICTWNLSNPLICTIDFSTPSKSLWFLLWSSSIQVPQGYFQRPILGEILAKADNPLNTKHNPNSWCATGQWIGKWFTYFLTSIPWKT